MKKAFHGIMWGLCFITLGVIFLGNILDLWNFELFFDGWWTLFIIIPAFIGLITGDDRFGSALCLVIGASFLLCCQDYLEFSEALSCIIAFGLILFGIKFIYSAFFKGHAQKKCQKKDYGDPDIKAIFGTFDKLYKGEVIKNTDSLAIFGTINMDLRGAKFENDVLIEAVSVFGSTKILVDEDVDVVVNGSNVIGGTNNTHHSKNSKYKLYINSVAVFGGLEVK